MGRPATGQVIPPDGKAKSWAIRFHAYGKREFVTLGRPEEDWSRPRAEEELRHVLADVERGIWRPHKLAAVTATQIAPTFHEFSSEWMAARAPELRPRTVKDYRWALSYHLLPHFASFRLDEIDVAAVDRYKAAKAAEAVLAPAQVNKTLKRLAQILELAVDYGYMPRNPAASKGGRRRLKEPPPKRTWVEPEQLMALLDAAPRGHRPVLATLVGVGLRVGELCALDWRDVNLATGTLTVQEAKTSAGAGRQVDLPLAVADELRVWAAQSPRTAPDDPVFVSGPRNGVWSRQTPDNVGRRLKTAIKRANKVLAKTDIEPISERVSPHSLRRTYISLRAALHDDPVTIAEQVGHEDPSFTLRVYAKATKRRERLSGAYLEAFDRALEWAEIGRQDRLKSEVRPQSWRVVRIELGQEAPADICTEDRC
jgi:integrase